ncbi:MAG TPA: amidohydrolase family protein [Acidimicrobiia bacterium]|nr:amidohydrolase family protein [Acidimicrobiia bacterium]
MSDDIPERWALIPDRWALIPDRIWDGHRIIERHALMIDGDRITSIQPGSPSGVRRVEVQGTAVPGLIDSHVHLADWMLPGLLAAGVTTVRDTGNRLDWILERRRRTTEDPTSGPTILCTGPLLDGEQAWWPTIGRSHVDVEAIRMSVRELAAAGVDAVKLYVNVTPAQIAAAVETARGVGLDVLAHLGVSSLAEALAGGVAELEHLSGCVHHVDGPTVPADETADIAERLLAAGTTLCPTLVVWDRLATVNDMVFANDRRREWVHPGILDAWSRFPHRTGSAEERLARQGSAVAMKSILQTLHAAGCRVIAGSDAPWPNIVPGFGLHDELALMVDAGLRPHEALAAATVHAAAALGVGDQVGALAPGYRADVVVVRADPLVDILALGDIRLVVRAGRPLDVDEIRLRMGTFDGWEDDPVSELILHQAGVPAS